MRHTRAAGVGLGVLGTAGYVGGVLFAYPGRALSLPAVMVGLALVAVGEDGGAE